MKGSLRLRLMVALALILLFGTAVQAIVAYRGARAAADDQFDYQMEQLAISIAQGLPATPDPNALRLAADVSNFDFIVQVWGGRGVRVFATEPRILIAPETPNGLADWHGQNRDYRIMTIREPGRVIQVAQDQAIRARLAGEFAWRAIAPIALWAPLVLLVGLGLLDRALRPLGRVREQLAERRADDLAPIDDSALPNEIRPVITDFNALLGRLKTAFDSQGRFVADAAHELRTPLAALTLQVQALGRQVDRLERRERRGGGAGGAAAVAGLPELKVAVDRVSRGLDRAARLVDQLLVLAREDHRRQRGATVELPAVDLVEVAGDAIAALADLAEARGIDLGLVETGATSGPASAPTPASVPTPASTPIPASPLPPGAVAPERRPGPVPADREALGMLLRNLVDNAIKYTPRGGTVDVRVEADGADGAGDGAARLVVEDSGPGVSAAERERLFDRFHRGPITDGDDEPPTGSGLGLAIVEAIAERHRATIVADASPTLGGLRVTVTFPAADRHEPLR